MTTKINQIKAGYKIAFMDFGQIKRWRILRVQNDLALITEGWGLHKVVPLSLIESSPYMIEQTQFPWYLKPFYYENIESSNS